MPNAPSYAKLREMTVDELVSCYDERTENRHLDLGFYREEIARRDAQEQTFEIIKNDAANEKHDHHDYRLNSRECFVCLASMVALGGHSHRFPR